MPENRHLERAAAWARTGTERVRPLLWPTLQTAVGAGLAWELCVRLLDHPQPIFAPIVSIVAMGFTAGRRGRAAVLLVLGVAIGIGIGDLLVRVLDRSGVEVAVVVFVAMSITLFLTRESLDVGKDTAGALVEIIVVLRSRRSGIPVVELVPRSTSIFRPKPREGVERASGVDAEDQKLRRHAVGEASERSRR